MLDFCRWRIIVFKSNKNNSKSQLKPDLAKVKNWTFQLNIFEAWSKEANHRSCFSNKHDKESYPSLQFNSTDVQMADSQKQLGLILDSKLTFSEHIESKITKSNKIIGVSEKTFFNCFKKGFINHLQFFC